MRKFGRRASAALLLVGTMGALATAQTPGGSGSYRPAPTAATSNLWEDWFGSGNKPKPVGDKPPAEKSPAEKAPAEKAPPRTAPDKASELQRYINAYHRRSSVCLRLREIAMLNNDAELAAEVDRLDDLIFQVYEQQTSRLLGAALLDGPGSTTGTPSGEGRAAGGSAARTASLREGKR